MLSLAIGLVYIQSHSNIAMEDIVQGTFGPQHSSFTIKSISDIKLLANASSQLGRIDLQIEWLLFLKKNLNISSPELLQIEEELKIARKTNDEILLKGGGYLYDKEDNRFMISSKKLLTTTSTNDFKAAQEKIIAVEKSVFDIDKHDRDMSDIPGYVNKLLTVRMDIINRLCQNKVSTSPDYRCHQCMNHHNADSYMRLGPHKVEIFNKNPTVAIIHQFISDAGK